MSGLTKAEREALRSRVERNWPFEVDATTADEIRDIADGVAGEVERIVADRAGAADRKVAAVEAAILQWWPCDIPDVGSAALAEEIRSALRKATP